jgi:hypothetical protein
LRLRRDNPAQGTWTNVHALNQGLKRHQIGQRLEVFCLLDSQRGIAVDSWALLGI